jgi:hypothetical protein
LSDACAKQGYSLDKQQSLRQYELLSSAEFRKMDDDSVNFGSDAAGATPGSNSILAQPPLQGENASPSGQEEGQGEGQPECKYLNLI